MIHPFVSIIVPVFNEEKYITQCLESLLRQSYPGDRYEIFVVDGGSIDDSPTLVARLLTCHPQIHALRNPARVAAGALNIGLRRARGEIIVRMDAHALAPPDYVSKCVEYLLKGRADNVGGIMHAVGSGYWGKSIALGTSCAFGVGGSKHRCSQEEGCDEAGWPGAFWRRTLVAVGGFDEQIGVNEDDDLNCRLLREGRRVFRTPEIKVTYFCRNSLGGLWSQYFRYGFWKVQVIRKFGRLIHVRHLLPATLVLILLATVLCILFSVDYAYPLLATSGLYFAGSVAYAIELSLKHGYRYLFSLPVVFATLHLSYGTGFITGLACGLLRRGSTQPTLR